MSDRFLGQKQQGVDEQIAYSVTTTNIGSSPTSPSVKVYQVDGTTYTDVTSTVMPAGSATVSGDDILLPVLKSLTAGYLYRVEVKFSIGSAVYEVWFEVLAER